MDMNPGIVPAVCPLRSGPLRDPGATADPGSPLSYPSFSQRTPGPRNHGPLGGSQKDIGSPKTLRQGVRRFLKNPAHCTDGTLAALRSAPWQRHHRGSWVPAFLLFVFPANAGTQGPRSSGRQPKGHRATKGSAARSAEAFKELCTLYRWNTCCAEVRSVAAAPPRFLGPRFPTLRFPGERRDPGTTELWTATKRTSDHQGLCSTEGAVFSREPKHRAGGKPAALRSAPWQRRHRGS